MTTYLELDEITAKQMVKLLDRKNKLPADVFMAQAVELLQTTEKQARLDLILSAKTITDLPQQILESEEITEIRELFLILETLGITAAVFDITLMRGLDYYTGTVFEVFDTDSENNRSLFGGGRYDGLVGMFGVEPVSAVGFAPGLTTTELFLRSHNLLPEVRPLVDVYVVTIGDVAAQAFVVAQQLRAQAGRSIEVDTTGRKLDKQIKSANKKNARYVIVVGENEAATNQFTLKNLQTGEEQAAGLDVLASLL